MSLLGLRGCMTVWLCRLLVLRGLLGLPGLLLCASFQFHFYKAILDLTYID